MLTSNKIRVLIGEPYDWIHNTLNGKMTQFISEITYIIYRKYFREYHLYIQNMSRNYLERMIKIILIYKGY